MDGVTHRRGSTPCRDLRSANLNIEYTVNLLNCTNSFILLKKINVGMGT